MDSIIYQAVAALSICGVTVIIYLHYYYVDFKRIKGIPEIPGGSLLAGHLYMLGGDHASTLQNWSIKYSWPIYQVRLGYRRAIILNSFGAAREWVVTQQTSTIDRPWLYTFHGVVSKTSAATIGTNPWNERTKKQRRVVGSYTTAPSIRNLTPTLSHETSAMISGILEDGKAGVEAISPHIYQKRLALNIILMFSYARRFERIDDPLLVGILEDANTISSFRSTNSNAQDYIPHLRYLGGDKRTVQATEVRSRRDKWLAELLEQAREDAGLGKGKSKKCVAQGLLDDEVEGLTKHDIRTILGGLMSGGFETVFATAIIGIAVLASPRGQAIQKAAYADIMSKYDAVGDAWEHAASEEKSQHVVAFVREVLRFYPPLHLLPPRQTWREFEYEGVKVPKGVLVYMNAQAINHDTSKYGPTSSQFLPERWLKPDHDIPPPYHFSYGAGARMCTAVNFSNRILYAIFFRLILSFEIHGSKVEGEMPDTDYVGYNKDRTAASAIPKDFKARFMPRDMEVLRECLKKSNEMSADL